MAALSTGVGCLGKGELIDDEGTVSIDDGWLGGYMMVWGWWWSSKISCMHIMPFSHSGSSGLSRTEIRTILRGMKREI